MAPINAVFAQRLELLLSEKGIKKTDLANHLAVERSTITRYTQGRIPDAETLDRLAQYFGVSTDFLLGRTDDPKGVVRTDQAGDDHFDDELVVVFRGKRQKLTPEYQRMLVKLMEAAAEAEAEEKQKGQP